MKAFGSLAAWATAAIAVILLLSNFLLHQRQSETEKLELSRLSRLADEFQLENTRLSNELSALRLAGSTADAEKMDLLRLRNEVTRLRALQQNRQQQMASSNSETGAMPEPPQTASTPRIVSRDSWHFAGYADPASALESLMWAAKTGDVKTLLGSLAPNAKEDVARTLTEMSEADFLARLQKEINDLDALRLDRMKSVSDTEVTFVIFSNETDNGSTRTRSESVISFTNIAGQWKSTGF